MTAWPFFTLAILAGVALTIQAAVNAVLVRGMGNPLWAAATSFTIGLLALLLVCALIRAPLPALAGMRALPWWAWAGGALGAVYVASTIIVIPRLGAATLVALVVAGQMLASLLLDHYGSLGLPQQGVNIWRVLGALMLIGGVIMIRRF